MGAKTRWTQARRDGFLAHLAETANVTASCRAVGMAPSGAYGLRKRNAAFAAAWSDALDMGLDALEAKLIERAFTGIEKDQYYAGKFVGTVRTYSDTLAMFYMKSKRPEVYGDLKAVAGKAAPTKSASYEQAYGRLVAKLKAIRPATAEDNEGA